MCLLGRQADPEVYPRPDGTVYVCGESEMVVVPDDPLSIKPRPDAVARLQARLVCLTDYPDKLTLCKAMPA